MTTPTSSTKYQGEWSIHIPPDGVLPNTPVNATATSPTGKRVTWRGIFNQVEIIPDLTIDPDDPHDGPDEAIVFDPPDQEACGIVIAAMRQPPDDQKPHVEVKFPEYQPARLVWRENDIPQSLKPNALRLGAEFVIAYLNGELDLNP